MSEPQQQSTLEAALAFARAGCSVVPAMPNGSKRPLGTWLRYQRERADEAQIRTWFDTGHPGVGVVCGEVSGGLVMVEAEGAGARSDLLGRAREIAVASGLGDLWRRITHGYWEATPGGGFHWLYRITDAPVPGNQKLARRPGAGNTVEVLAETRGEGGFTIVAPSHGPVHPSGKPWTLLAGNPDTIPSITLAEHTALCSVLRALDQMPTEEDQWDRFTAGTNNPTATSAANADSSSTTSSADLKPGDDYNLRASWQQILEPHGWTVAGHRGDILEWCRPGKRNAVSATTGYGEADVLFVFSTSTTLPTDKGMKKFETYARLNHDGDFSTAARELRRQGYGSPLPDITPLQPFNVTLPPQQPAGDGSTEPPLERTTWAPVSLLTIINGDENDDDQPTVLARNDGHRILYAGKVNGLVGESESGKTWVALQAAKQTLEVGGRVLYLDFEDTAKGIVKRLRTLGLTDSRLDGLTYIAPDESLHDRARVDLTQAQKDSRPALVVVDGFNAAMTLLGLELKDNTDITNFFITFLRPLRDGDAAVLTVDHVVKNRDNRGDYAIGGQAKRAMVDGSYIGVEALKPFGRGQNGRLRLTSLKDRPGFVRAVSTGAKTIGTVEVISTGDDMEMRIVAPNLGGDKTPFRPTHLMEKISVLLESMAGGDVSGNAIEKQIGAKAEHVRAALERLVEDGCVTRRAGSRNSVLHTSTRPYREADEAVIDPWSPDED